MKTDSKRPERANPFTKKVPQEFGGLAWITLANGPSKSKFPAGLTFVRMGRITLIVRYPSRMVGIYRTNLQSGNFECLAAVDPTERKRFPQFKFQPLKAAAERAESAFVEGKLLPSTELRLPQLYRAVAKTPDPADCNIEGLQALAGSEEGSIMMETFYKVIKRFGEFTMLPLPLIDNPSSDSMFESVEGMISRDGHGIPQAVYNDCLRKHGLGEENLTKVMQKAGV
jgi:hypothetical protein